MWNKVDDKLSNHLKIERAGRLIGPDGRAIALGMFVWGLNYSAVSLTDGFIPTEAVRSCKLCRKPLLVAEALAKAITRVGGQGLWVPVEGGWHIHDYHVYNPRADEVRARRDKDRIRKENERRAKLGLPPISDVCPQGQEADKPPCPGLVRADTSRTHTPVQGLSEVPRARVPSRPDPVPSDLLPSEGVDSPPEPADEPMPPRIATGPHRNHATCGRPCVPSWTHEELRRHLGGTEDHADQMLRAWYVTTMAAWEGQTIGDKPEAFWWARFREWQGTTVVPVTGSKHTAEQFSPDPEEDDWFGECKRLHSGKCNGSRGHRLRLAIDAEKATKEPA